MARERGQWGAKRSLPSQHCPGEDPPSSPYRVLLRMPPQSSMTSDRNRRRLRVFWRRRHRATTPPAPGGGSPRCGGRRSHPTCRIRCLAYVGLQGHGVCQRGFAPSAQGCDVGGGRVVNVHGLGKVVDGAGGRPGQTAPCLPGHARARGARRGTQAEGHHERAA